MRRALAYFICAVLIVSGSIYGKTLRYERTGEPETMAKGVVLEAKEIELQAEEKSLPDERQWSVRVQITSGPYRGRCIDTEHYYGGNPAYDFLVYPGDEVVLSLEVEDYVLKNAYIANLSREKYLYYLFALFIAGILLVGARQGLKTVVSLLITGWAILKIMLPALLAGRNPLAVTLFVSGGITIITLLLIAGLTRKSLAAIAGTMVGVLFGGLLARHIIALTKVNGMGSEESRLFFYTFAEGKLDFSGLLFAGIVIGALGAVMDVAMSIASSVNEIHEVDPDLSFVQLTRSGLNIGRDIIGTMANTLVLAYTGSALTLMLLLLANAIPYLKYINLDLIATEVIRALAGSLGMVMAVPFTAVISAALCYTPKPSRRPAR
ncbi:MAG: YibE/F family protein [Peptococcaceae bacterium]|jgi:uncharacterized membrane protein|nr:YibE/F family protein [Peptococcaceae bacterium]MDH7524548.1 YibE/F family protein [Peptococcaceae bacterium]